MQISESLSPFLALADLSSLLSVLFGVFFLSMWLSIGLWVRRDAGARGSTQPTLWALASVFTPVGLPYYLYKRYRRAGLGDRSHPPTTRERIVATWASATLAAYLGGAILAPPDPFSQMLYIAALLVLSLPAAYLSVFRGLHRTMLDRVTSE